MRNVVTSGCLFALASLLIPVGVVRADLPDSDVGGSVPVATHDGSAFRSALSKYTFERTLRADPGGTIESGVTTTATRLTLPSDMNTTTASSISTATFDLSAGSLLDSGSSTSWPSGRYTEQTQQWVDPGQGVTGGVSEVPIPASALLALVGLSIVGVGCNRFAPRG